MKLQAELCHSSFTVPFTFTTTFPSVFFLSLRIDAIHHLCAGQSLTVWARKLDLQMVSYTDDEAHTAAPAGN